MPQNDFETIWQDAIAILRGSLEKEEAKNQMDRYLGQFLAHELRGNECVITVAQPLQVEWFTGLYSRGLASALCAAGADPDITVRFAAQAATEIPPAREETAARARMDAAAARHVRAPARRREFPMPELDANYTFDNFVRGPSNSFAHAAAQAVAKDPGRTYNPLFIWGDTGLGKTHLMQAIGHEAMRRLPGTYVCYITSETLLNEYVSAIQNSSLPEFRNKYRNTDILLIDDIQFMAGKRQIQEEFFNTFNALQTAKKQIVITCDVAPRDISGLEARLLSRFQGGMVIEIESPSYETRLAILKSKARAMGRTVPVPDEALDFIAENIHSHVRALEGALKRVCAVADINPSLVLDREQVRRILRDSIESEKVAKELTISEIRLAVAKHYNVTVEDILSTDKSQSIVTPRQVAMFLARKLTVASLPNIAESFKRTHATIHHGVKTIEKRMEVESQLYASICDLVAGLGRNPEELKA